MARAVSPRCCTPARRSSDAIFAWAARAARCTRECARTAWSRWTWACRISSRAAIPLNAPAEAASYHAVIDGEAMEFGAVSIGNPHAVLRVADARHRAGGRAWARRSSAIRTFPQRTNVGFMQIVDRGHIRLRVFERGVGETLACGTGACAAVAVGRRRGIAGRGCASGVAGRHGLRFPGRGTGRTAVADGTCGDGIYRIDRYLN